MAPRNLIQGAACGLGAAIAAALIWFSIVYVTNYEIGWIAILIGVLVGFAVVNGSGRCHGRQLQLISVVLTLFSMALAEYLITRQFLIEAFLEEGITNVPLMLPLNIMAELVWVGITAHPPTLFFWAIAMYVAFRIPQGQKVTYSIGKLAGPGTPKEPAPAVKK